MWMAFDCNAFNGLNCALQTFNSGFTENLSLDILFTIALQSRSRLAVDWIGKRKQRCHRAPSAPRIVYLPKMKRMCLVFNVYVTRTKQLINSYLLFVSFTVWPSDIGHRTWVQRVAGVIYSVPLQQLLSWIVIVLTKRTHTSAYFKTESRSIIQYRDETRRSKDRRIVSNIKYQVLANCLIENA